MAKQPSNYIFIYIRLIALQSLVHNNSDLSVPTVSILQEAFNNFSLLSFLTQNINLYIWISIIEMKIQTKRRSAKDISSFNKDPVTSTWANNFDHMFSCFNPWPINHQNAFVYEFADSVSNCMFLYQIAWFCIRCNTN